MRLGYSLASQPAIACVDPAKQRRLLFARAFKAEISQELHITIGYVRKRLRRGPRVRCGHVCDTIVCHTFLDVNGIEMRRWSRGLGATALINRNIYKHAAAFHLSQHCTCDQLRRFGSGQKHCADEQIAIGH